MITEYNQAVNEMALSVYNILTDELADTKTALFDLNDIMISAANIFKVHISMVEDDVLSAFEALPVVDMLAVEELKEQGRLN